MNLETRHELEAIAARHGFTLAALQSKGRFRKQCVARQECYEFLWMKRGWSTPQIGRLFNRDHSTIVWFLDNQGTLERKRARCRKRQSEYAKIDPWSRPMGARRVA